MALKTHSDENALSEINVTPLVDVMLVLVIILLITAPLLTQSIHVKLPETAETTANVKDQPVQLAIDENGVITLNKQAVDTMQTLEKMLRSELAKNKEVGVHLYADQVVLYKKVAEVMAAVQHAGIAKIAFVTVEE